MHFTYEEEICTDSLSQGDVLGRTAAIESILQQVHPHYAERSENRFFQVLTQSCDLVRRKQSNGTKGCSARYISLAPVRSVEIAIGRFLEQFVSDDLKTDVPVCSDRAKIEVSRFLARLYNNNESRYFYLEAEPARDFPVDSCAFLPLSIAVKSEFHYDALLEAKILQLREPFQAKLGWLVGQMYSRVGTQDWSDDSAKTKIDTMLDSLAVWLPERKHTELKKAVRRLKRTNDQFILTKAVLDEQLSALPNRREQVATRIAQLVGTNPAALGSEEKLRAMLFNDSVISTLIKD
ncbi:MAG: hypothetical protein E6R14_07450 [Thermomicrobiales bacterium]|jgi:flagellar biosynthesis regulator FlaF|nr:MAG: hypothetical protein E6R14_07450 [Thermomicrobiales bacterium]